jgi:hypothetical protein
MVLAGPGPERVLFIGTQFSNLYTAVDIPARGRVGVTPHTTPLFLPPEDPFPVLLRPNSIQGPARFACRIHTGVFRSYVYSPGSIQLPGLWTTIR